MYTVEFWLSFIGVAALVAVGDVFWTLYFIATSNRQAIKAAVWSALTIASGALTTLGYVHDIRLLGAAMLGAFIGTWATILYTNKFTEAHDDTE